MDVPCTVALGGKYNAEMKRLLLDHAFKFVNSVIFMVGIDNLRSQNALEKIGATRQGRRPNSLGRDSFVYRIMNGVRRWRWFA